VRAVKDAMGMPQSVLVLGGGSDIALATVRALVGRRCRRIVLGVRDPEGLASAVSELKQLGATQVDAVAFDADDADSHGAFVEEAFSLLGEVDLVLVAFGVLGTGFSELLPDPSDAIATAVTNYVGTVSVGMHLAHRMVTQGHGTLAVLSSVAAERTKRNFVYASSKAGLDAFAMGLGDALVGSGVKVLVVRPGFVRTKMTTDVAPAPFATDAEGVAEVIVRALETGAEEVWAPPMLRFLMSGLRHLPRPLFRRMKAGG